MKDRARKLYLKEKLTSELFRLYEKVIQLLRTDPILAKKHLDDNEFDIKMLKDILNEDLKDN